MAFSVYILLGYLDLEAMIFGELDDSDDIKWKLLLWSLGLSSELSSDLQKLKKEYVSTVLALMFLLQVKSQANSTRYVVAKNKTKFIFFMQTGQITLLMADTVLVAQYHIQERKKSVNEHNQPTEVSNIRTESVRVAHMFNRVVTLMWDCLMVCGLQKFIVS